jgi:hypothetical protein
MCASTRVALVPGRWRFGIARSLPLARGAREPHVPVAVSLQALVDSLAGTLVLGSLLEAIRPFELVDHWTQGEFHHDVVVRLSTGLVLVVATNCNGGVKEVLAFDAPPDRTALWAYRCPGSSDFPGEPATPLARSMTVHWFDPCELLAPDARSELLPEHRIRQEGGGWIPRSR